MHGRRYIYIYDYFHVYARQSKRNYWVNETSMVSNRSQHVHFQCVPAYMCGFYSHSKYLAIQSKSRRKNVGSGCRAVAAATAAVVCERVKKMGDKREIRSIVRRHTHTLTHQAMGSTFTQQNLLNGCVRIKRIYGKFCLRLCMCLLA